MLHPQFDPAPSQSLFAGTALMPSQPAAAPDSAASPSKGRAFLNQGAVPVTVKQIADALASCPDKSKPTINGIDISCVRVLGLVMNKVERATDVSFTIDDGTGRINFIRWITEASDTNELATIENGMYIKVNGSLKQFHSKGHVYASLIRRLTNFNEVTLHFIECVYINLESSRQNNNNTSMQFQMNNNSCSSGPYTGPGNLGTQNRTGTQFQMNNNNSFSGPFTGTGQLDTQIRTGMDGGRTDMYCMVLGVFQEPAILALEHGLHVEEVVRKLGMPSNKVLEAINYLVDVGHIYSTIDESHFKSAHNY
ncbi:hypothetical protein LUZ60_001594 [Juncus effusus]|nr:hypothetical protein LUZ60_001594 [Juncus effusus]